MELVVLFIIIILLLIVFVNHKAMVWRDRDFINCRKIKRSDYGYIYFYRGKKENPFRVKIGRTNNWENRLTSARTSVSPHGIYILGATIVKDDVKAEKALFDRFSDERIRDDKKNEWFNLSWRIMFVI